MTPRDLNPRVLQVRLAMMRDLLADLALAGKVTVKRLETDRLLRYAIERILTQLVELASSINSHISAALLGKVSGTYQESFRLAAEAGVIDEELARALAPSVGLRNILVHVYVSIDLERVASAVPVAAAEYSEYVRHVARWLSDRAS
jgi:uncharacterized protein YutE (UPF0331/DUF86 family)